MDTVSPGLEEALEPTLDFSWLRLTPAAWAAISLTLLFGAVAFWRLAICFGSVLACTR